MCSSSIAFDEKAHVLCPNGVSFFLFVSPSSSVAAISSMSVTFVDHVGERSFGNDVVMNFGCMCIETV